MLHQPQSLLPSVYSSLNTLISSLRLFQTFTSLLANVLNMGLVRSRQVVPYVPSDKPPPTIFDIRCHPQADTVCAELDSFFVKHWPFKSQKERERFLTSQINRFACLVFPMADDDRLLDMVKLNTLLFLLDGKFISWLHSIESIS